MWSWHQSLRLSLIISIFWIREVKLRMIKQTLQVLLASILKTRVPASVFRKHDSDKCPDKRHALGETQRGRSSEGGGLEWCSYKPRNCPEPPETGKDKRGSCPGTSGGSMVLLIPRFRTSGFQIHKRIIFIFKVWFWEPLHLGSWWGLFPIVSSTAWKLKTSDGWTGKL